MSNPGWVGADVASLLTAEHHSKALSTLEQAHLGSDTTAAQGVLAAPGDDFLRWVARYLQSAAGMAFALVAEVWGVDRDRVRTVAVCRDGELVDNFEYDLRGTPCANVIAQDICVHPAGVAAIYPEDELLAQMQIEAYVGLALNDDSDAPLGLMILLDQGPISDEKMAHAVSSLELLRNRVSAELSYHASLWSLEAAIAGTTAETLELLVAGLGRALHVRCAFVGRYLPNGQTDYPMVWADGESIEIGAISMSGTPAEQAWNQPTVLVPRGAQLNCNLAQATSIPVEAYLVCAVRDREGNNIGLIGVLHDRELPDTLLGSPVLRVFRSRIGAELLRFDAEEKRNAAQRSLMEAQRREGLGTMAGGIAHDFNNLLVGILGNAELLLQDADETIRDECELIVDAANQASALCRQLLVYAGKGAHVSKRLDLNEVLLNSHKMSAALVPTTCQLSVVGSPNPAVMEGDPVQIQQLVLNLIKNAGDAVEDSSGRIEVNAALRTCTAHDFQEAVVGGESPPGNYCHLSISDNGCGMGPELLHKVFDPFFSTKRDGHGLGLATALGIVGRHRGVLLLSSSPRAGTRFDIYFPAHDAPSESLDPGRSFITCRYQGEILIIDDDATVLKTLAGMLRKAGFTPTCANRGVDGVEEFARTRGNYACVILDLSMPGMDGGQVVPRLREIAPRVPILLATGFPESEVLREMPMQPDAILMKPFELDTLVQTIARLCALEPTTSALNA